MIDYQEFKRLYEADNHTPGFILQFKDKAHEYIIIKYSDSVQFSRCGINDATAEYYESLDKLLESDQIDGINLQRDWEKITHIYPEGYGGTFVLFCEFHGIEYRGELIAD